MCVTVLQWKCSLAILKWRNVKNGQRFLRFLRFFDMTLQKTQKVAFLNFQKRKKRILELWQPL